MSTEDVARVRTAMQGVDLGGYVPTWARHDPEERWLSSLVASGHARLHQVVGVRVGAGGQAGAGAGSGAGEGRRE